MKKLKRKDLKKIDGGLIAAIIMCDENMNCPANLCCTAGNICKDRKKYPCI
ncbi:hypothetical protein [Chryseobacterium panacisoli]|uniref:hypothetical protein n=1 Tax=Chryseobacterium panacisoli TaxID=1807141 RepID=UPI00155B23C7|nr:hypothetical protein [Chryseobacterium panacisoli]